MSRKLVRAALVGAIVIAAGGLSGCAEEEESCNSSTTCSQTVQTCCTSSDCHYTVNGRRFDCNGTNCDAAASQVVAAACGRGDSFGDASAAKRSLLGEAALATEAACRPMP